MKVYTKMQRLQTSYRLVISCGVIVFILYCFLSKEFKGISLKNGFESHTICKPDTRKHILEKKSLPIIRSKHVDVRQYETSGCFAINANEYGINRIMDERNFIKTKCLPLKKRFMNNSGSEQTSFFMFYFFQSALASIPGSGTTWTRHLLEDLTGIHTGCINGIREIADVFKGELAEHNVIVVKTHYLEERNFSRAIIIVRDPFESTRSAFNRVKTNKTGLIPESKFSGDVFKGQLIDKIKENENVKWINNFKGDLFVLYYDKMKTDLANSLSKLAAFLQFEISLERLWCTLNNQKGSFKRGAKPKYMSRKVLVDEEMERRILKWRETINDALVRRGIPWANN